MNKKILIIAGASALAVVVVTVVAVQVLGGGDSSTKGKPSSTQSVSVAEPPASVATPPASSVPDAAKPLEKAVTGITIAIPLQYDSADSFSEGLALVATKDEASGQYNHIYIDKDGHTVITLPNDISFANSIENGRAQVTRRREGELSETYNYEHNFIDATGKLLLDEWLADEIGFGGGGYEGENYFWRTLGFYNDGPGKHFSAIDIDSGCWVGMRVSGGVAQYAVFGTDLKIVIPFGTYDYISMNPDRKTAVVGRAAGEDKDGKKAFKYGVVGIDGKVIISMDYSSMSAVGSGDYAIRKQEGSPLQLMLPDGTTAEPEGYAASQFFELQDKNVVAFHTDDYKCGAMDKTGKIVVVPGDYSPGSIPGYPSPYNESSINKPIEAVVPTGMEQLSVSENSQIIATGKQRDANDEFVLDVRVGLADIAGNILVKPTYECISNILEGVFIASTRLELDESEYAISPTYILVSADESIKSEEYDSINGISEDMVLVSKDGKYGFLKVAR